MLYVQSIRLIGSKVDYTAQIISEVKKSNSDLSFIVTASYEDD
jgi:hypothetical protein